MKYEAEINNIISEVFPKEDWMTEDEHKEISGKTFEVMGISKQELSNQIEIGVKNGYSVSEQMNIIKMAFNKK